MSERIIRNAIRCVHCGVEVESGKGSHLISLHSCAAMRAVRGENARIGADGGHEYLRRIGHPADMDEISETDPPLPPHDPAEIEARMRAAEGLD